MKYTVRFTINGDVIDDYKTFEEAQTAIKKFEAEDEAEGCYEEYSYEIIPTDIKLKGVKKAVGAYQALNADPYSAFYGRMMLDRDTGELWTDEFYDIGHNSWKEYHSESIINLVSWAAEHYFSDSFGVSMRTMREAAEQAIYDYVLYEKAYI